MTATTENSPEKEKDCPAQAGYPRRAGFIASVLNYIKERAYLRKPLKIILLATAFYVFLTGIMCLSTAFKGFGKDFALQVMQVTENPFVGLLIGILVTSIMQSSSTTTSMIVGFVSSGAISIPHAVPMVMGANIGTTVTNTFVSFGYITRRTEFERAFANATAHDLFNSLSVICLLPLEIYTGFLSKTASFLTQFISGGQGFTHTSPVKAAVKPTVKAIKHLLMDNFELTKMIASGIMLALAIILIFASLFMIVKLMRSTVAQRTEVVFNKIIGKNGFIAILMGLLFTALVQSSSVTTSILVPIVGAGVITLEQAFPIAVGANIGTTVTALLASLTGTTAGLTIAVVHLLFNISGAILFYGIPFTRGIPLKLSKKLSHFCVRWRPLAIIYVLVLFFIIPLCFIVLPKLFQ